MATELLILDVGHGSSALVIEPDNVTLVDVGFGTTVTDALRAAKIQRVNTVLVSHADADHCGALATLLIDETITVDHVVINADAAQTSSTWEQVRRSLAIAYKSGNTTVSVDFTSGIDPTRGHREFRLEVLAPDPPLALSGAGGKDVNGKRVTSNTLSAVLRVWKRDIPLVLFAGDIDKLGLDHFLNSGRDPHARILVFPHHGGLPGSRTDPRQFAARLCAAVKPDVVAFSLGRDARYKNPRIAIMQGVRDSCPKAHVICTQLSASCAQAVPNVAPTHLSDRVAQGRDRQFCCGGSLVLDDRSLLGAPTVDGHMAFVRANASTAVCLGLSTDQTPQKSKVRS